MFFSDSFYLLLRTPDLDRSLLSIEKIMDFSNYHSSHKLYDSSKKGALGLLKNEMAQKGRIKRFVGLKSKVYSFQCEDEVTENRCKGIKKVVRKNIPFSKYLECIKYMKKHHVTQHSINSKLHLNKLIKSNKLAFSSHDSKRFLLCSIHSVPYGSFLIDYYKKRKKCLFCENPFLMA